MTYPVSTAASIAVPRMESRQARLDAAIALFRSEASASGYVVEEVRLRLPVPDVDVMPRVVIAQQSASSTAPPIFPRAKQLRSTPSHLPAMATEHQALAGKDLPMMNGKDKSFAPLGKRLPELNGATKSQGKGAGFKRTVSGSVIFHPIPARTSPSPRENLQNGQNLPSAINEMGPLSSIPYLPRNESNQAAKTGAQQHGQFWKTVIGSEKGKQILQAAENIQKMGHIDREQRRGLQTDRRREESAAEASTHLKSTDHFMSAENTERTGARTSEPNSLVRKSPCREGTHHINGHEIPESDVQLLLSSAADISARELKPVLDKANQTEDRKSPKHNKKSVAIRQQPAETKSDLFRPTPTPNTKNSVQKGRRDSLEKKYVSSAARPYKCTKCPSSFDREGHLRVHILAVHEKKRPFVCQVCDASFGHSSSLLRHVRTVHQASPQVGSGRLPISSRNTPNSVDSATTKSEGISAEEQDDSEKHFRCSACRMAFNRVALLNRHVAEKHPLQTSLSDNDSKGRTSP